MKEVQRWNDFPRSRGSQGQSGFNPHSWDSSYREHQSYKGWTALNTGVPSDLTLSQTCTPACFQNASNIKEIYLHKKKKKSIPQFPQTPLFGFTWLNLGNVIGDFILPKSTEKAGPEDYITWALHPQSGHKSTWHRVYPWVVDEGPERSSLDWTQAGPLITWTGHLQNRNKLLQELHGAVKTRDWPVLPMTQTSPELGLMVCLYWGNTTQM